MKYQLLCGDSRKELAKIKDESIDSIITDPPYGISLSLQWTGKFKAVIGDGRDEAPQLCRDFLPHAHRIARPDTAHLFFGCWGSTWIKELLAKYFTVKGCIVWYKNTWGLGWHLRPRWELAWYCHKGKPPIPAKAMPDVWEHKRDHRLTHPCQKPVSLLRQAIQLCLPYEHRPRKRQPIICDPFAGIGSLGVAAVAERCDYVGFEVSKRYVEVGQQRIANALRSSVRPVRVPRTIKRPRDRQRRGKLPPKSARNSRAMRDSLKAVRTS